MKHNLLLHHIVFLIFFTITIRFHSLAMTQVPDTSHVKSTDGFAIVPFVSYAPETKFTGGIGGFYYFRIDSDTLSRPSTITTGISYSERKQIGLGLYPELYFSDESLVINSTFEYYKFPSYFFGIGTNSKEFNKENYISEGNKIIVTILANLQQKSIRKGWNVGFQFDYRFENIQQADTMSNGDIGLVQSRAILGSEGGVVSGAGLVLNLDTRDNLYSAMNGSFVDSKLVFYGSALGSDYTFRKLSIDFRSYFPAFTNEDAVTCQAFASMTSDGAPFYKLSDMGGEKLVRGYFGNRFRDNNVLIAQAEYRTPIWWRFGAVGFVGIGDVFTNISAINVSNLKIGAGAGIRFAITPEERLNLRLDIGFGKEDMQLYLGFFEAW